MAEPIKVGDLVVIVRLMPCCGWREDNLGFTFHVTRLEGGAWKCLGCGDIATTTVAISPESYVMDVRILKRIPPLSELDDVKQDEEITA